MSWIWETYPPASIDPRKSLCKVQERPVHPGPTPRRATARADPRRALLVADPPPSPHALLSWTSKDFVNWEGPITVGWLPDGSGDGEVMSGRKWGFHPEDGSIWTAKSMDRNPTSGEYL